MHGEKGILHWAGLRVAFGIWRGIEDIVYIACLLVFILILHPSFFFFFFFILHSSFFILHSSFFFFFVAVFETLAFMKQTNLFYFRFWRRSRGISFPFLSYIMRSFLINILSLPLSRARELYKAAFSPLLLLLFRFLGFWALFDGWVYGRWRWMGLWSMEVDGFI